MKGTETTQGEEVQTLELRSWLLLLAFRNEDPSFILPHTSSQKYPLALRNTQTHAL